MIFRQEPDKIQAILNDLLEVDYVLMIDVIATASGHTKFSISIRALLEECITRLIQDAIENPNMKHKNYFTELKEFLKPYFFQQFQDMHVRAFLLMENHKSLKEAFSDNKILDMTRDKDSFLSLIISELVLMKSFYSTLFNLSKDPDFVGWKYYFVLVNQFLTDNPDLGYTGRMKRKKNII